MSVLRELRVLKPACRKFPSTIGHVFAAKYTELEHLPRRQFRFESRPKVASHCLCPPIDIALLHFIVHSHSHRFHCATPTRVCYGSENAMISLAARWFDQNNRPSKVSERDANGTIARSLTSGVFSFGSRRAIRQSSVGFSVPRRT